MKIKDLQAEYNALDEKFKEKTAELEAVLSTRRADAEKAHDEFIAKLMTTDFTSISKEISAMAADAETAEFEIFAEYCVTKPHPAVRRAEDVRELKEKTKSILTELKIMQHKYNYLLQLFPDLEEYADAEEPIDNAAGVAEGDETSLYLSKDEYKSLSETARNQLAFDRYVSGHNKSKWQVGRDYELYIGYVFKRKGYSIQQCGIEKRLEDLGRDLVCTKLKEMLIIQCKYWAEDKLIHEKHIFQLFGTMTLAKLDNPLSDVKGVFVTSTTLSDAAKRIADFLGIEVKESIALGEFPRIKCNINNGERVYHLPFDQQYDTTKIENVGEFYAFTVLEAEQKGFRRACRHLNY